MDRVAGDLGVCARAALAPTESEAEWLERCPCGCDTPMGDPSYEERHKAATENETAEKPSLDAEQLAEALDDIISKSGPITRQWAHAAARRIVRRLESDE